MKKIWLFASCVALAMAGCQETENDSVEAQLSRLQSHIPLEEIARADRADAETLRQLETDAAKQGSTVTSEQIRALRSDNISPQAREALKNYFEFVRAVNLNEIEDPTRRAAIQSLQQRLQSITSEESMESFIRNF